MRLLNCSVYAFLLLAFVGADTQAAFQAPPPPPLPPEQGNNGPPDRFLEGRRAAQQSGAQSLQAAGRAENLTGLRQVIGATLRPRPWTIKIRGATPQELARQDIEAVAQYLATIGYGPKDVAPGAPNAAELIHSAGRVVLGGSTFDDEVRVAPVVVVADLLSVSPDATADEGYNSTATLRIVKSIKGGFPLGQNIAVRQRSGPDGQGSYVQATGEFRPHDTGQYLLFLSPAAYELRSGRKSGSTVYYAIILAPYEVNGQQLDPIGDIGHGPVPLSAIGGI